VDRDIRPRLQIAGQIVFRGQIDDDWHTMGMAHPGKIGEGELAVWRAVMADDVEGRSRIRPDRRCQLRLRCRVHRPERHDPRPGQPDVLLDRVAVIHQVARLDHHLCLHARGVG
jgi:hypothetical protein